VVQKALTLEGAASGVGPTIRFGVID
jgi:hypothetical protein